MGGAGACLLLAAWAAFSRLCTGWLFLFAVLMAAGLLFTMVFFVRLRLPRDISTQPAQQSAEFPVYRSLCSPTWSATTSTP
jgi:hypothetical protein